MQFFKYQMINKFSSIDNSSLKQKKYKELRGEIYLITSADTVWQKWKIVFERHKTGELINPDTRMLYNLAPRFKSIKPSPEGILQNFAGAVRDGNGEGGNAYVARQPNSEAILGVPQDSLHKAAILCSFMLHNEGMDGE